MPVLFSLLGFRAHDLQTHVPAPLSQESNMHTVHVGLGSRSYDIHIASGILDRSGTLLADIGLSRICIITNTTVAALYLERMKQSLVDQGIDSVDIILPDGEQFKTLETMHDIYQQLLGFGLDRASAVLALGGGVVGDMAGFAAATFMRGIPFIQFPTTLLAQVDSSVGGKTGVNLPGGKNMVGAFHQPVIVIIDPDVLGTLSVRELRAGFAEVIKYGIIQDPDFFGFLDSSIDALSSREAGVLAGVISRCCAIKADIVERDETEQGIRAQLNYGHTLGHAVETLAGYGTFLHGEAVAIGMCAAAGISAELGECGQDVALRIRSLVSRAGLPTDVPAFPVRDYIGAMLRDKKKAGSTVKFVLPRAVGDVFLRPFTPGQLERCLAYVLPSR